MMFDPIGAMVHKRVLELQREKYERAENESWNELSKSGSWWFVLRTWAKVINHKFEEILVSRIDALTAALAAYTGARPVR